MKYTPEERLDIGRQFFDGELSRYEACAQYGIGERTARNYMRMYRDANHLPAEMWKKIGLGPFLQNCASWHGRFGIHDEGAADPKTCKARITEALLKKDTR